MQKKAIKRNDKKKTEEKKEDSENEISREAIRGNVINVREYSIGNGRAQHINKVEGIENELTKNKRLSQDLRIDAERVCAEYDKLHNKNIFIKVKHEALVEKLKDKLCGLMFLKQEE